tara:strand:+ start:11257 stop:11487 length:231 start_codon:yes stop_codon:yes gene_type:complete
MKNIDDICNQYAFLHEEIDRQKSEYQSVFADHSRCEAESRSGKLQERVQHVKALEKQLSELVDSHLKIISPARHHA